MSRPLLLIVTAATLFGLCNVAWRFGEGQAAALAATRAAVGVVVFGPLVFSVFRFGAMRRVCADRVAVAACLLSGSTLWTAAFLFRSVPGPLAAAVIGVAPVVTLLVGRVVGSRVTPPRAVAAIGVAMVAAVWAAGPQDLVASGLVPAALFLGTDVTSVLVAEAARRRHGAAELTVGGLLVGAAPAPFFWVGGAMAISGLGAAVAVAVLGTAGRFLRAHALGSVSAAAVASSAQVTALVTAVGGAVLFADELGAGRFGLLLVACAAAVAAIRWSTAVREESGRAAEATA